MRKAGTMDIPGPRSPLSVLLPVIGKGADQKPYSGTVFFDGRYIGHELRIVCPTDSQLKDLTKGSIDAVAWSRMIGTFQLRVALEVGDSYAIGRALARVYPPERLKRSSGKYTIEKMARISLSEQFAEEMKRCRPVLWLDAKTNELNSGILCRDPKSAIFVRAAIGDLRACPYCSEIFRPDRPDQIYCTIPHRENFRKQRFRAKAKAKSGG